MVSETALPYTDYVVQWTTSDGGRDHYPLVDEGIGSPDDLDYVSSAVDKQTETFFMTTITSSYVITIATLIIRARVTIASSDSLIPVVNIGGTDYTYSDITLGTSFFNYTIDVTNKPIGAGGGTWTQSELTSSKWGFRTNKPTGVDIVSAIQLDYSYNVPIKSIPHAGI